MSRNEVGNGGSSLLVVEDDPAMLIAFRDILESEGYSVSIAANGVDALMLLDSQQPDLILSDISMPLMDGIKLLDAVRERPNGTAIPFIFITARGTREDIFAAKAKGVDDYITKPVTRHELLAAVEARLKRTDELKLTQLKTILRVLANAIEGDDPYTFNHVEAVNAYAQALAVELGWEDQDLEALELGAILHDIGKIRVRYDVLTKTGPLDAEEWKEMRKHPRYGADMIRGTPYLEEVVPFVLHHHERWDGEGYPAGLAGREIPLGARLLAVADTFHAMTSNRPYREARTAEDAFDEILAQSGKQFDPSIVEAFQRCWQRGEISHIHASIYYASPPERAA